MTPSGELHQGVNPALTISPTGVLQGYTLSAQLQSFLLSSSLVYLFFVLVQLFSSDFNLLPIPLSLWLTLIYPFINRITVEERQREKESTLMLPTDTMPSIFVHLLPNMQRERELCFHERIDVQFERLPIEEQYA